MLLVTRVHSRRVLVLGAAGLVPAALVTLLLVHQPSIGDRRLYPLLRGSLAFVGLALALAALITWATAADRLSRSSLTGLAWAGVTTILCIGPFLESAPRARLYALDLESSEVEWSSAEAGTKPKLVDDYLVVTDVAERTFVFLNPKTGVEQGRHSIDDDETEPRVGRALAAGAYDPGSEPTAPESEGLEGIGWSLPFPSETVAAVTRVDDVGYAYVATPGADEDHMAGRVVKFAVDDGEEIWTRGLPEDVEAADGAASIAANDDAVVVAGGELVAALDADDGELQWTESVVTLGKSRGYALPGAVQDVTIGGGLVYLSTAPES